MSITLHIERLVLDGLPVGTHELPVVQAAVEAELARLLGDDDFAHRAAHGGTVPLMRAKPMRQAVAGGEAVGTQIGQAIYGAIGI